VGGPWSQPSPWHVRAGVIRRDITLLPTATWQRATAGEIIPHGANKYTTACVTLYYPHANVTAGLVRSVWPCLAGRTLQCSRCGSITQIIGRMVCWTPPPGPAQLCIFVHDSDGGLLSVGAASERPQRDRDREYCGPPRRRVIRCHHRHQRNGHEPVRRGRLYPTTPIGPSTCQPSQQHIAA
jgi:hypothetical protein